MIHLRHMLILLTLLGFAHMATAQDFEAVERRLGEAISEGELTIAQAHAMMQALKGAAGDERSAMFEQGVKKRLEAAGRRLKEAVRSGLMTEEEAEAEWARIAQVMETGMKIRAAIAKGELAEEQGRAKMDAIRRKMDRADVGIKIREAVARGELTAEEGRAKMAAVRKEREAARGGRAGIAGHYRHMGVTKEALARVKTALKESGVTDEQIAPTLGGMLRTIHMIKSTDADKSEIDERLRGYFAEEVGLNPEQIEVVQGLASRLAMTLEDDEHHDDEP